MLGTFGVFGQKNDDTDNLLRLKTEYFSAWEFKICILNLVPVEDPAAELAAGYCGPGCCGFVMMHAVSICCTYCRIELK